MTALKIRYTVKPDYTKTNKKYIQELTNALKRKPIKDMKYSAFTDDANPNTFIHIIFADNQAAISNLINVPEFKAFKTALEAANPGCQKEHTSLNLVSANFSS